jgi:hypothetical protein
MTGIHPKKGKYEWVSVCESCPAAAMERTSRSKWPHCYCTRYRAMCFRAFRKCKEKVAALLTRNGFKVYESVSNWEITNRYQGTMFFKVDTEETEGVE